MMELTVSNIAWTNSEEEAVAEKLQELGVKRVEIAPTKTWEDPTKVSAEEAVKYVEWWRGYGIEVSAFQSMLFARPDLKIFESEEMREELVEYMGSFLELAGTMGAKKLVFGSPKNRQRGEMAPEKANEIAYELFARLGGIAAANNVVLCLEPNAPQYNCDFITTASEGAALVRGVNSEGFKLHLDTACMALAGDDIGEAIRTNADILEHFHVSAPMLDQVEDRADVDYEAAAQALKETGYDKLVSIEMRPGEEGTNVERVEKAVAFVRSTFDL